MISRSALESFLRNDRARHTRVAATSNRPFPRPAARVASDRRVNASTADSIVRSALDLGESGGDGSPPRGRRGGDGGASGGWKSESSDAASSEPRARSSSLIVSARRRSCRGDGCAASSSSASGSSSPGPCARRTKTRPVGSMSASSRFVAGASASSSPCSEDPASRNSASTNSGQRSADGVASAWFRCRAARAQSTTAAGGNRAAVSSRKSRAKWSTPSSGTASGAPWGFFAQ